MPYLRRKINGTQREIMLWLDVYCIPLGRFPSGEPDPRSIQEQEQDFVLKQRAISRMNTPYSWAKSILVLDQEVMQRICSSSSKNKRAAVVATCAWNMRCWTYQEFAFARAGQFLWSNANVRLDFGDLRTRKPYSGFLVRRRRNLRFHEYDHTESMYRSLHRLLLRPSLTALSHRSPDGQWSFLSSPSYTSSFNFLESWNALCGRSTSQPDDMVAILANLLNLNARSVLRLAQDSRIKAVLKQQGELPMSLLFAKIRRLGDLSKSTDVFPPDGWVPASLQNTVLEIDTPKLRVTPEGLLLPERLSKTIVTLLFLDHLPPSCTPMVVRWPSGDLEEENISYIFLSLKAIRCLRSSFCEGPTGIFLLLRRVGFRRSDNAVKLQGACLLEVPCTTKGRRHAQFVSEIDGMETSFKTSQIPQHSNIMMRGRVMTKDASQLVIVSGKCMYYGLHRISRTDADS